MRNKAQRAIPDSGPNTPFSDAIVTTLRRSNASRNERIQAHIVAQNRPPPAQRLPPPCNEDMSTSTVDTSLNDISFVQKMEPDDPEDSFGFSEDDAFLAAVDLDVDLGHPIEEESDTGRPIHDEDFLSREDNGSSAESLRHSGGAIHPPPLKSYPSSGSNAQAHGHCPMQNQNPVNASAVHSNAKKVTCAPAGGFHFPPEMARLFHVCMDLC